MNFDNMEQYVLTHTFDDIKNSQYFYTIFNKWYNLGYLDGEVTEKTYNKAICLEQLDTYFRTDEFLKPNYRNSFEIKTNIFSIVDDIYDKLPLSDYDYIEILDTYNEAKSLIVNNEIKPSYSVSDKIIELINNK